jgi:hypothetical protein
MVAVWASKLSDSRHKPETHDENKESYRPTGNLFGSWSKHAQFWFELDPDA